MAPRHTVNPEHKNQHSVKALLVFLCKNNSSYCSYLVRVIGNRAELTTVSEHV